jgi:hypothetical protein
VRSHPECGIDDPLGVIVEKYDRSMAAYPIA